MSWICNWVSIASYQEKKKKEAESVNSEDASNNNDNDEPEIILRPLSMEDMKQAKNQVGWTKNHSLKWLSSN